MSIFKSVQQTKIDASPRTMLRPNEMGGRVRIAWFEYTVPAVAPASADTIVLTTLPKGARILGGMLAHNDLSDVGNSTFAIGDGTTATKYKGASGVYDGAGELSFANTIALSFGQLLTAETSIIATVGTAALTPGQILKGYIFYAVD